MTPDALLLMKAALAIAALVLLIGRLHLHPFLALTLAAAFLGLTSSGAPVDTVKHFEKGFGGVLESLGLVVGLGTMLGGLLLETGGADRIVGVFAQQRRGLPLTLCGAAFLIGLPHLFDVSFVMLVPLLFVVARRFRYPVLGLAIPMVAGLLVSHSVLVPHPAPTAAMTTYHADAGKTILYGFIVAIPILLLTGPVLARLLSPWLPKTIPDADSPGNTASVHRENDTGAPARHTDAPLAASILAILIPPGLMLLRTVLHSTLPAHHPVLRWADLIGDPVVSLLIAVLFAIPALGIRVGFSMTDIQRILRRSVVPAAGIILILGAGGGFKEILAATHASDMIAHWVTQTGVNPLLMAWSTAALIRIAIGSATVATVTTASVLAPLAATMPHPTLELMVIATSSGSQMMSHVNDTGFWLFKEYFKLSVVETLRTWTLVVSLQSLIGLLSVLLLHAVLA